MKFLILGAGSIGKRHLRNLLSLGIPASDLSVVEVRPDRIDQVRSTWNIDPVYTSLEDALARGTFQAAVICTPTSRHIPEGIALAKRGISILMEKPLAHNLDGIEELRSTVAENGIVFEMAYIFRFSPLIAKLRDILESGALGQVYSVRGEFSEYLPDWHPWEDYRTFYMARKSQGGGSILDQSHIMDLIHYLFGGFASVYAVNTRLSRLEIEADDLAEMVVTLKSGIVASIHTDIFGRDHKKYLDIKGERGNLYWDHYMNRVTHYDAAARCSHVHAKFPTDFNLIYQDELRHFLARCRGEGSPKADLQSGIETMKLILAAERSHRSGRAEPVE